MNIKDFYTGKTILLTGATGFVGKVVLEKFMRALPNFKRMYVMVRPKKTVTIQQRLQTEILDTEIFNFYFAEKPELKAEIEQKIVAVAGDLIVDGLGMSRETREMLTHECDIIINCAASVNFDDPLLDAIQINFAGCKRMLDLAKECQHLEVFTHVSTAYTNSDKFGFVEEKIRDLDGNADPDELIESIMRMGPQAVKDNEKKIVGNWPNTYTFTKSMAERSLKKNRGNLRVAILRPSIIVSCYDEPC